MLRSCQLQKFITIEKRMTMKTMMMLLYVHASAEFPVRGVEVERCRVSGNGAPPQTVSKESLIASRHKSNFGFPCLY